jgi:rfaE bifunctional protein nucleotidyltransferase chain/domain
MSRPELEQKIFTLEKLLPILESERDAGKILVTNNGSYDIMHLGHIEGLFYAKSLGDILIVGVNSDASVRAYKGPNRPINDDHMRTRMLAALSCVDYVFTFDETVPMEWLAKIKPHIHTNGAEYGELCIERDTVVENGGHVVLLPMVPGYKTSQIIDKILTVYR